MLIMLKMSIFERYFIVLFQNSIVMKEKIIKLSNEEIQSLSLDDFGKNVIEPVVINYSLSEIASSPYVTFVTDNELDNIFVIIKSKDKLMIDCFGDVIAYCNLYFDTSRGTVIIQPSAINSNAVVYTVILFKDSPFIPY